MFGLNQVSWSEFLLLNLSFCVVIDLVLLLLLYFFSQKRGVESSDSIRRRRSVSSEKTVDENLPK
jgi:hypothetical protein